MLRRQARQRREYIYRKALESKEKQIWERKQAMKEALAKGKKLSKEEEEELANENKQDIYDPDDEYSQAGVQDPRILITTSRDPSTKLTQFAKEMRLCIPNSHRINRGNYVMREIVDACRANEISDLIILHEHRGVPDALVLSHFPHGPTLYFTLHNTVLRHDTPDFDNSTVSQQYPHLVFENFSSKLGERVKNALRFCFPVPREDSKRTMSFINEGDFISFRHHVFVQTGSKSVQLAEVGPRFEMRPYEIKQGTVDQSEADVEFALRPYHRTARKRQLL